MDRPLVRESGATLHFVDDRFETVEAVAAAFDGQKKKIRVYLADWYVFVCRASKHAPATAPPLSLSTQTSLLVYALRRGYNTNDERQAARRMPGVQLISISQFIELLTWGIVMGVDDGCEPDADEVLAGVYNEPT